MPTDKEAAHWLKFVTSEQAVVSTAGAKSDDMKVSGLAAWFLGYACTVVLVLYLAMNLAYSFRLKHEVLADVMVIAVGFVAGGSQQC